jgi:phage/plasmid-associated DNA primase
MLNIKDFKIMIHSNFPNERADIIAKHMKDKYFIKSDHLYSITEKLHYEVNKSYDGKLLNATSILLQKSFKNLDNADQEDVRSIKRFSDIFNNSHIKTYLPQLIETITDENIQLDNYLDDIHFINGLYNLATGKFSKRKLGKHYITDFIQYEYVKPTPASIKAITNILRKTYSLQEDFECICKYLGAALTGRSTIDQHALFLLGQGSSGKSNIMAVTQLAIECYLTKLKGDTFSVGNTKLDKILTPAFRAKCFISEKLIIRSKLIKH